MKMIIK